MFVALYTVNEDLLQFSIGKFYSGSSSPSRVNLRIPQSKRVRLSGSPLDMWLFAISSNENPQMKSNFAALEDSNF